MQAQPLDVRPARREEYPRIEEMVIDSFGPITWARTLDERFGPLNSLDWRARWSLRMKKIFEEQTILAGEAGGALAAMSSFTYDERTSLAYIDLIAVDGAYQHRGYGRAMLRATMDHLRAMGAQYLNLDCLTTNGNANELYRSEGFEEVARHIRWFRKL